MRKTVILRIDIDISPSIKNKINLGKIMEKSYFEQREINCIERTNALISEMPYFLRDFFIGVEMRTSPLTRLNYAYDLRVFFDFLVKKVFRNKKIADIELKDIDMLTATDIEYFMSYLNHYEINGKSERCTESGKARKLSTLRSFYKYFFNKNMLNANVAAKVEMPKIHEKEIIRLDSNEKIDEIGDMLYVVDSGSGLTQHQKAFHEATRLRDSAIITLFLGTGIRISELVGLNVEDFDFNTSSFVVTRKGGNRAVLYYNEDVAAALNAYFTVRNGDLSVPKTERAAFISLQNKRISTRTVQELVKKYARIVSPLKHITPHKLRSTFGTNLYRQTKDIYVVADCLGHKNVETTKKHYAAITEDIRKKAALSLDITGRKDT